MCQAKHKVIPKLITKFIYIYIYIYIYNLNDNFFKNHYYELILQLYIVKIGFK